MTEEEEKKVRNSIQVLVKVTETIVAEVSKLRERVKTLEERQ